MQVIRDLWNRFFFTGETPENLGLLRIWIGFGLLPFHALQFDFLMKLDPEGPAFHFLDPIWYFNVLGVHAVDVQAAIAVFWVLMLATVAFALGLFTRTSLVIVLVSIMFLKGVRDSTAGDIHHRYLIPFNILLLFLFSRCHQVYSIDAWWKRKRSITLSLAEWEASWPIKAAQLYVCSFYFWSAIAKLRMTGLEWASTERLQDLLLSRSVRNGFEAGGPSTGSDLAYSIAKNELISGSLAQSTYLFELGFPLILLIRDVRVRLVFFAGITLFHVANFYLINVQFLFLPVVFALFFDLSQPLRKIGLIHGIERAASTTTPQRNYTRALAVYWTILWIAVFFRIDRFPLSWAPMYSVWAPNPRDVYSVKHIEKGWLEEYGWRATHRDGSQSWINRRDLNVRKSSMRRMYYRRTRGRGPPKEGHYNHDAGTFDRWLWGLAPGEPYYEVNWRRRLFESINKTFGHLPADLQFIVRLEAKGERFLFQRDTLEFVGTTGFSAEARWDEAWAVDF
ncbi:MAG: HTTM domain-containing protein [Deltaproteobacteria bacterium]|nr:HTTM domain-containing protein [Deltaproteobacteria bacterium]